MSAILLLFRKMVKNKWLILCQFLGFILFASLIAGIPIFTQGIMQKYLVRELQQIQTDTGGYPGRVVLTSYINNNNISAQLRKLKTEKNDPYADPEVQEFLKAGTDGYYDQNDLINDKLSSRMKMPEQSRLQIISSRPYLTKLTEPKGDVRQESIKNLYTNLSASPELFDHVSITSGSLPSDSPVDGIYEAVVPSSAIVKNNLKLNDIITLKDTTSYNTLEPISVKIVGVFEMSDLTDPIWLQITPDNLYDSLFIQYDLFLEDFLYDGSPYYHSATWYMFYDYQRIDAGDLNAILSGYTRFKNDFTSANTSAFSTSTFVAETAITKYVLQSRQISNMMWALYIPVIFMLCLYSFMISKMIINNDENEISLLISRGSTRLQITLIYAAQGLIIGLFSLLIAPLIAYVFSSFLGASNGFLQFANRKALSLSIDWTSYQYAAIAVLITLVSVLLPAIAASKNDIIGHKRSLSRGGKLTFWEKSGLDIICLVIAGYGYFLFTRQRDSHTGFNDPLLFIVPVLFIIGCGLLFLRIYPFIIRLIYWIGRKKWSSTSYITLTQVGRSLKNYHFLMIFLIMTLSVGMYSTIVARTLGTNVTDHIKYTVGSDIVLTETWPVVRKTITSDVSTSATATFASEDGLTYYEEPSYSKYDKLEGIEHKTKVFRKDAAIVKKNNNQLSVYLMGIEPYDFGMTSSLRTGLNSHHFHEYLNVMTTDPSICLVSSSLLAKGNKAGISVGDTIEVGWAGSRAATLIIGGSVDYWPGINAVTNPDFIIADLSTIQEKINLEPYEIWIKLQDGTTDADLYESMEKNEVKVSGFQDVTLLTNEAVNQPSQMTINGSLTLGFLISCFVCLFGFIIYWILAIKQRTLQFGIFRAIGISSKELVSMIIKEQLLTSIMAAVFGVIIGFFTGVLFVPFYEMTYNAEDLVPPFRIISLLSDRFIIYAVVLITVITGIVVLGIILSKIKINQALKLGED